MARGIIEGVSGAGFPTGWKEKTSGEVFGSAITKNDPIVLGRYGSWDTVIDKIPDITQGGIVNGISFFGDYMALAISATPLLKIYKRSTGDGFTLLDSPTGLPTNGGGLSVAFSPDGNYLAVGSSGSTGYLTVFSRSGDVFTKTADATTMPSALVTGVCFSPDNNYLAVSVNDNTVKIYKKNGSLYDYLTGFTPQSAAAPQGLSFSPDGTHLVVAVASSPFVVIYSKSGDVFTKLPNPSTLPTGWAYSCDFSPDGKYLAVAHTAPPFITIYSRSGDTFTKIANPSVLPTGSAKSCAFDPSSSYLSVAYTITPFVTNYSVISGVFTKLNNPSSLPQNSGYGNSFSDNGEYLAVGNSGTSPYLTIYRTTAKDIISKISHFQTNPLSWLPNNDNIGIAMQSGAIGETININLFPALNNI